MCMVIVSSPVKGKTNGEIMMKRVSGQLVSKGDRYHQKFVLTYELNHKWKAHKWSKLFSKNNNVSLHDFITIIHGPYSIGNDIGDVPTHLWKYDDWKLAWWFQFNYQQFVNHVRVPEF